MVVDIDMGEAKPWVLLGDDPSGSDAERTRRVDDVVVEQPIGTSRGDDDRQRSHGGAAAEGVVEPNGTEKVDVRAGIDAGRVGS